MKLKTIGFPISHKENEYRRALIPKDISKIKFPKQIYIEKGYGEKLGFSDYDYLQYGVNIGNRKEILSQSIICDPKIGDAEYLNSLEEQTIFGWIHAVQNPDISKKIINSKLTAYAWEDMFEDNRHIFYKNNEIAGKAAVIHAYMIQGLFPNETKVAILGRGNIAKGAAEILSCLGAEITIFSRKTETLFKKKIQNYDVIVNAILWDNTREDHIIYETDLKKMKKNSLIIDISCDKNGGIETSIPTTIDNPTYIIKGITHYVVDHTPSLFFKTSSKSLSQTLPKYINQLIEDKINKTLKNSLIIKNGIILDKRINNSLF